MGHSRSSSEIRELFDIFDLDKSGYIDFDELVNLFKHSTYNLCDSQVAQVLRLADINRNGKIEFNEFTWIKSFLDDLHTIFTSFLGEGMTTITSEQMCQAIKEIGQPVDNRLLETLCQNFDPSSSGVYSFADFLSFIIFMKRCWVEFDKLDERNQGVIHLTYDQFVQAVAQTR